MSLKEEVVNTIEGRVLEKEKWSLHPVAVKFNCH